MLEITSSSWLVTGGCGFIGSEFIRQALAAYPQLHITNLDALSYAASPERLAALATDPATAARYTFIHGDVSKPADVQKALAACQSHGGCKALINFAAESHVDRSIFTGIPFVTANTLGVQVLMEQAKATPGFARFVQVSTDEVYGDVPPPHRSAETDPLHTSSPYSASKAGADLLVQAFVRTHKFPAVITRCCNNYGPWHWPEKMIPLFITNLLASKRVPVYGDGQQRREWIHVADHAAGVLAALLHGRPGEIYNFGTGADIDNLTLTRQLLALAKRGEDAIEYVTDRPGHDRRYALDATKARRELGWAPKWTFEQGLAQTFNWFVEHQEWLKTVLDEKYQSYYRQQYENRRT